MSWSQTYFLPVSAAFFNLSPFTISHHIFPTRRITSLNLLFFFFFFLTETVSFSNKAVDRNFYLLNEFDKKKNVKENYFFLHVTLMFPFTFPLLFVIFFVCVFILLWRTKWSKIFPQKFSVSKAVFSLTFHYPLSVPWPSSFMYHSNAPRPGLADKSERAGRPKL